MRSRVFPFFGLGFLPRSQAPAWRTPVGSSCFSAIPKHGDWNQPGYPNNFALKLKNTAKALAGLPIPLDPFPATRFACNYAPLGLLPWWPFVSQGVALCYYWRPFRTWPRNIAPLRNA